MYDQDPLDDEDFQTNDLLFDRLADGELPPDEYRRALAWADNRPDGWRRCALALLEAQALKRDLVIPQRPTTRQDTVVVEQDAVGHVSERPNKVRPYSLIGLAVAASLILAFSLGYFARPGSQGRDAPTGLPGESDIVESSPIEPADTQPELHQVARPTYSMVTLMSVSDGEEPRELFTLPVAEFDYISREWFEHQPSAMPDYVVEALEQGGYMVYRTRQYMPVDLEDGRQVVVPVEDVQIVRNEVALFQ